MFFTVDAGQFDLARGTITGVDEVEVKRAAELYASGKTLAEVRARLVDEGNPSRSINTIRERLHEAGHQLRRAGRRPNSLIGSTIEP